eukprot:TRINITY_DN3661_c0_g1_i1.p1 TRINITY_DN3661_c0_g1~~TRINITY_DN3661_c0_g1_i1.p1  ORF type:complete len:266 (-),score=71.43 TRINITY_DN3661_c0_g1_i1:255-1052(-)
MYLNQGVGITRIRSDPLTIVYDHELPAASSSSSTNSTPDVKALMAKMETMSKELASLRAEVSQMNTLKKEVLQLRKVAENFDLRLKKLEQPNEVLMNLGQAGDLSLDFGAVGAHSESESKVLPFPASPKANTDIQEILSVSVPALTSAPIPMNLDEAPTSEVEIRKRVGKIVAAVPPTESSNPNAALINFCKHQLKFDVEFRCTEENDTHYVKIIFPDDLENGVAEASDKKKKRAKEIAAKLTLQRFNTDTGFLQKWIDWAMAKA